MTRLTLLLLAIASILLTGCDGGRAKLIEDLKYTGEAHKAYLDEYKVGPSGWEELIQFAQVQGITGEHMRRLREAGYEMKWNVKLADIKEPTSTVVLAKPPGDGPKLMLDGSVQP